ncbi:hypothetical protein GCM10010168_57120 [Actinoplanes ianthinogenes]|uniref:Uncharacterized protein n=1 Tax=Actinoplanes ianthinogenes TaxID=122358 RepID=A0ABM7M2J5_9ACTN|nr:hypothetical protein [Actinoplanes ianthinogenes]BCJ45868.1 hypothetical protein Aiant_65250 [Actinoplanes ianthinogenes]GGR31471.1 hypothetical protein GCM10010168_57120 [Actinoplanes ianthinogenes]
MHNLTLAFEGAWKVLLASLILGAGLPAIFALGVRSLAYGGAGPKPRPLATAGGYAAFAVVLLGVLLGIAYIVASGLGKTLTFEHVFPAIADKH